MFPGVKRPGRGVDHPPPSSAEVNGRVELYLYSLSGPSWSGELYFTLLYKIIVVFVAYNCMFASCICVISFVFILYVFRC